MTDMARLHTGRVGAQFWSVYIPSEVTGDAAIRETLEQIDTVKRLVKAYPNDLALAATADDIVRIHKTGRSRLADRGRGRPPDRRQPRRAAR